MHARYLCGGLCSILASSIYAHNRSHLRSSSQSNLTHMTQTNHMWTATGVRGGRGFHRSVSHISWARPVCVDSHPSYELRFSMCTFKYSHITSMHPCRNNQNKLASTKYGDKVRGSGVCFSAVVVFKKINSVLFIYTTISCRTGVFAHSHTPSFFHLLPLLITTVPQRALWRVLLYSPAHHHA